MKTLLVLIAFAMSSSVFAADCVNEKGEDILNQPEVFQALIEKADSCWAAKSLAEACAWGSSLDVATAGAAYSVCQKDLDKNKPSKSLTQTLNKMNSMCNAKYSKMDGTLYRSMNSYCQLTAIGWIVDLASDASEN